MLPTFFWRFLLPCTCLSFRRFSGDCRAIRWVVREVHVLFNGASVELWEGDAAHLVLLACVSILIGCVHLVFFPCVYIQKLTDFVFVCGNTGLLNLLSVIMLVLLAMQLLIGVFKDVFLIKSGQQIDVRLILGYYKHLLKLP